MAIKPISIRTLEDRFIHGCAEERCADEAPERVDAPRAGSFRLRGSDSRAARSDAPRGRPSRSG